MLSAGLIFFGAANVNADTNDMLGIWEYQNNGDLTGIHLKDAENCEIFVERALKPRSTRTCKYEPFEDRFLIFLFNEHGACNSQADFQFIYDAEAPVIRLLAGGGSEVVLRKTEGND